MDQQPGAVKKLLPQIPHQGQDSSPPRSVPVSPSSPQGPLASYGPFFLEYALLAEYNQLRKQRLPGLYVVPSAKSALHWFGVLFIRQGIYQEGVFKFDLIIPENYPDGDCPKLIFHPPVFHPMIDPQSGELDVQKTFSKWRRSVNHIWQVLLFARRIFYKIDTGSPLNPEAASLFDNDLEMFKSRAYESVQSCKSVLYEPPYTDDPHAICFTKWNDATHGEVKKSIMSAKQKDDQSLKNAQTSGLSWVKPETMEIFSDRK